MDIEHAQSGKESKLKRLTIGRLQKSILIENLIEILILGALFYIFIKKFYTSDNINLIFKSLSYLGIMAIGECMVFLAGGIDLSISSICLFSGIVSNIALTKWHFNSISAFFITLSLGIFIGFINGFIIARLELPSFLVTLGSFCILRGGAYGITSQISSYSHPQIFKLLSQNFFDVIPFSLLLLFLIAIIMAVFLRQTVFGRWIHAVGCNEEAAKVSGINIREIKILTYGISGLLSSIAGLIPTSSLNTTQSLDSFGIEYDAIIAVIIGGASIYGGLGSVTGTVMSALVITMIRNGLSLLHYSNYWQLAIIGSLILLYLAVNKFRYRSFYE